MVSPNPGILYPKTVVPKLSDEELYRSNLYHEELNEYADSDSASEDEYPCSDFDEYEEQLDFFMDNLDGSRPLAFEVIFEHLLLLHPARQSCEYETKLKEDHDENESNSATGEEDVYEEYGDEYDKYHQQSHSENGDEIYQEIEDEDEDEYPQEYQNGLKYKYDNFHGIDEEEHRAPFQMKCQPSTDRCPTYISLINEPWPTVNDCFGTCAIFLAKQGTFAYKGRIM